PFIQGNGRRMGGGDGCGSSLATEGRNHNHHAEEALAAGAGGAALGAAAMHRHNKEQDGDSASQKRYSSHRGSPVRKPLPDTIHTGDGSDAALLNQRSNSPTLSPFNSEDHHRSHSQDALLAGGAAAAEHHQNHGYDTDSGFYSDRDTKAPIRRVPTPLIPPIMTQSHHQQTTMPPEYQMVQNDENGYRNSRPISGIAPAAALGAHHR